MTTITPRLAYDDADAAEAMRLDAAVVGARLGVGREAWLDRGARSYPSPEPPPAGARRHG